MKGKWNSTRIPEVSAHFYFKMSKFDRMIYVAAEGLGRIISYTTLRGF